jgi:hypothetical protein
MNQLGIDPKNHAFLGTTSRLVTLAVQHGTVAPLHWTGGANVNASQVNPITPYSQYYFLGLPAVEALLSRSGGRMFCTSSVEGRG